MNILAISYCFLPWLAPRSIQESRILSAIAAKGHATTILQGALRGMNVPRDEELARRLHPAVSTIEVEEPRAAVRRGVSKLLPMLRDIPDSAAIWAIGAAEKALSLADAHSALLTFSSPVSDHKAGLMIKLRKPHLPWAAFFSDPFMHNAFLNMSAVAQRLNARLERSIAEHADALIFVNAQTLDRTMSAYPRKWRAKAHVIPHAFDPALYPQEEPSSGPPLTIRCLGNFYGKRTPESLFKALAVIAEDVADRLRLEMNGSLDENATACMERYGTSRMVRHGGRVGYLESLSLMKTADLLLNIDAPAKESLFLPSKLIDYLGARRPILAITSPDSPTADIMGKLGYPFFEHADTPGIAGCLRSYVTRKASGPVPAAVPDSLYNRYRVDNIADEYISVLERISR